MTERDIAAAALDQDDPTERAAYLDEACAGDTELRQRVEALLGSRDATATFRNERGAGLPGADIDVRSLLAPARRPDSLGRLDHYEVLSIIGRGGMGVVLRAFDERLHRVVAVKLLAPHLAQSEAARRRFVREARAAAGVSHDNIVGVHAVEESGAIPYLVMELVEGPSLAGHLTRHGPLPISEIVSIGAQLAAGLEAAHQKRLVHRDIKPANILLADGGRRVKITDFGLARAADDASLTQTGDVAGTPSYMSPEQADGRPVDHRSDLFSLGSVLYALCTGRPPFRADGVTAVLRRVRDDTPPRPSEINPNVPAWLEAVIAGLHAKNPADRFQSAGEVAGLLQKHLADGRAANWKALKPRSRNRRLRPAYLFVLVSLLIGLAAGTVYWIVKLGQPKGDNQPGPTNPAVNPLPAQPVAIAPRPLPWWKPGEVPSPEDVARAVAPADALRREDIPQQRMEQAVRDAQSDLPELVAILGPVDGAGLALAVAISPDSSTLAVAGSDRVIRLWDLATGKVRLELTDPRSREEGLCHMAFCPAGGVLATGYSKGTIHFWHPADGKHLASLEESAGNLHQLAFSADGKLLAAGRDNGTAHVWEVRTTKLLIRARIGTGAIYCVAFSPDGETLAFGGSDPAINLWDLPNNKPTGTMFGHHKPARCLAFAPDGKTMIVAGDDQQFIVRDVPGKGDPLALVLLGHQSSVRSAIWRADGGLLVTAAQADGGVRLWDPTTSPFRERELRIARPGTPGRCGIALSPEGRHLAVAHPSGAIYLFRLAPPGVVYRLP